MPRDIPVPAPPTDWARLTHGVSLLGGWLPVTVQVAAVLTVLAVAGGRTRLRRRRWVPLSLAIGLAAAMGARAWVDSQGLASDPAPVQLWIWVAVAAATVAAAALGWAGARWWRRGLSVLAVPLTLMTLLLTLNQWVGYYPTVPAAWNALTAGPLPDQVDLEALPALRDTSPPTGKVVEVTIPDTASGFRHRSEYVYLPPAWFAGGAPPALPAVVMIGGEFNTAADWMRSGGIVPIVDSYARSNGGVAPIFVFVDSGGSFNNDTECVNGPRGKAADHLTRDVRPWLIDEFGATADPAGWGVAGWSMGGTCAADLTVMHPELFRTFLDIAGDHGPTAGTRQQSIDRLFGGDAADWARWDPASVMKAHGPYQGVAGWFAEAVRPPDDHSLLHGNIAHPQSSAPLGYGGHDVWQDGDRANAGHDLCAVATTVGIECAVHTTVSMHTWQFATTAFSQALPWLAARLGA